MYYTIDKTKIFSPLINEGNQSILKFEWKNNTTFFGRFLATTVFLTSSLVDIENICKILKSAKQQKGAEKNDKRPKVQWKNSCNGAK